MTMADKHILKGKVRDDTLLRSATQSIEEQMEHLVVSKQKVTQLVLQLEDLKDEMAELMAHETDLGKLIAEFTKNQMEVMKQRVLCETELEEVRKRKLQIIDDMHELENRLSAGKVIERKPHTWENIRTDVEVTEEEIAGGANALYQRCTAAGKGTFTYEDIVLQGNATAVQAPLFRGILVLNTLERQGTLKIISDGGNKKRLKNFICAYALKWLVERKWALTEDYSLEIRETTSRKANAHMDMDRYEENSFDGKETMRRNRSQKQRGKMRTINKKYAAFHQGLKEPGLYSGLLDDDIESLHNYFMLSGYVPDPKTSNYTRLDKLPPFLVKRAIQLYIEGYGLVNLHKLIRLNEEQIRKHGSILVEVPHSGSPCPGQETRWELVRYYTHYHKNEFSTYMKTMNSFKSKERTATAHMQSFKKMIEEAKDKVSQTAKDITRSIGKEAVVGAQQAIAEEEIKLESSVKPAPQKTFIQKMTDEVSASVKSNVSDYTFLNGVGKEIGKGAAEGFRTEISSTFASFWESVTESFRVAKMQYVEWIPVIRPVAIGIFCSILLGLFGTALYRWYKGDVQEKAANAHVLDLFKETSHSIIEKIGYKIKDVSDCFTNTKFMDKIKSATNVLSFFERLHKVGDIFKEWAKAFADWSCRFCTGKPYFESTTQMEEWTAEVKNIIQSVLKNECVSQMDKKKFITDYERLVRAGTRLIGGNSFFNSIMSALNYGKLKYYRIKAELVADTRRQEPVVVWFTGQPGQGKTFAAGEVPGALFSALEESGRNDAFDEIGDKQFTQGMVHARKSANEYWEGYNNQWGLALDDVYTVVDPAIRTLESLSLIGMKNDAAYPLDMAAVELKGDKYFTSKLIVGTTNLMEQDMHDLGVTNEGAVIRRRDFIIIPSIDPTKKNPTYANTKRAFESMSFDVQLLNVRTNQHELLGRFDGLKGFYKIIRLIRERYLHYFDVFKMKMKPPVYEGIGTDDDDRPDGPVKNPKDFAKPVKQAVKGSTNWPKKTWTSMPMTTNSSARLTNSTSQVPVRIFNIDGTEDEKEAEAHMKVAEVPEELPVEELRKKRIEKLVPIAEDPPIEEVIEQSRTKRVFEYVQDTYEVAKKGTIKVFDTIVGNTLAIQGKIYLGAFCALNNLEVDGPLVWTDPPVLPEVHSFGSWCWRNKNPINEMYAFKYDEEGIYTWDFVFEKLFDLQPNFYNKEKIRQAAKLLRKMGFKMDNLETFLERYGDNLKHYSGPTNAQQLMAADFYLQTPKITDGEIAILTSSQGIKMAPWKHMLKANFMPASMNSYPGRETVQAYGYVMWDSFMVEILGIGHILKEDPKLCAPAEAYCYERYDILIPITAWTIVSTAVIIGGILALIGIIGAIVIQIMIMMAAVRVVIKILEWMGFINKPTAKAYKAKAHSGDLHLQKLQRQKYRERIESARSHTDTQPIAEKEKEKEAEAHYRDQSVLDLETIVGQHTYWTELYYKNGKNFGGFVICLGGKVWAMPNHYLLAGELDRLEMCATMADRQTGAAQKIPANEIIMKKDPDRDLVLMKFMHLQPKRRWFDSHGRSLTEKSLDGVRGISRVDVIVVDGRDELRPPVSSDTIDYLNNSGIRYKFTCGKDVYRVNHCYVLNGLLSSQGKCGQACLVANSAVQRKFMGINIGGDDSSSICAPIYTEEVMAFENDTTGEVEANAHLNMKWADMPVIDSCPVRETPVVGSFQTMRQVSKLDTQFGWPTKTKLRATVVLTGVDTPLCSIPPPYPIEERPALLRKKDEIDPALLSFRKNRNKIIFYNDRTLDPRLWEGVFTKNFRNDEFRMCTLREAILGKPEWNNFGGIDLTTGVGYPWSRKFRRKELIIVDSLTPNVDDNYDWKKEKPRPEHFHYKPSNNPEGKRGLWVHHDLQYMIYLRLYCASLGVIIPGYFQYCLKDERRPVERVEKGHTRGFKMGSIDHLLFSRMVLGWFISRMESSINYDSTLGINPYSSDWRRFYSMLTGKSMKIIAQDTSGWDMHYASLFVIPGFMHRFSIFFKVEVGGTTYFCVLSVLSSSLFPHYVIIDIVVWAADMPSGTLITASFNTIKNSVKHRDLWYLLTNVAFDALNKLGVNGDDSACAVTEEGLEIWDGIKFAQMSLKVYGHEQSMSDKSPNFLPYEHIDDVVFLQRKFRVVEGAVLAPLNQRTLKAMTQWIFEPTDKTFTQQFIINCTNALDEWALWGKQPFEINKVILNKFIHHVDRTKIYSPTFESRMMLVQQACSV